MAPTLEAPLAVIIWHHLTEKEEFARKNLGGDFNAMRLLGIHKRAAADSSGEELVIAANAINGDHHFGGA